MALSQQNNLHVQSRRYESDGATTSGRQDTNSSPATVVPLFRGNIISSTNSQSLDNTDALVCLQMRCLQSGMEILKKKHNRELQSVVENETVKRLRVKEVELETVKQKNKELEEQVMQKSAECQIWFDYARTTEAMVFSLRKKHDQALTNQSTCPNNEIEEGYGESSGAAESVGESDKDNSILSRRTCRLCQKRATCVLLLPCRHLCLCKECEARIDTCPVCNSTRNASIQVAVPSYLD